jgi:ubiquinone/menaquinone biosynthesis C-methylase UbiE
MTLMLNRDAALPFATGEDRGQAAFTHGGLALYDLLILRALCPWVWGCPSERIVAAYRQHLSDNHLEVGVGTGYFLDRARFSGGAPRVALLDLNTHCLARTARRIARYQPEIHQADVLQPIVLEGRRFDSIALNYVLHCLPAPWPQKGTVFAHLKALLNPGGTLFGATLVQGDVPQSALAVAVMRWFNRRGTLHNQADTQARLVQGLEQQLDEVQVEQVGCVALFSGRA